MKLLGSIKSALPSSQVYQYYHNVNSYRAVDILSGVSTILCGPFVALRHSAFKVSCALSG